MKDDNRVLNILCFEDEPDNNRKEKARNLYHLNFEYVTTLREGIEKLSTNPDKWDSIILDANMPEEEGGRPGLTTPLLWIQQRPQDAKDIPYYYYSGHGSSISHMIPKEEWQDKNVFEKGVYKDIDRLCENIRKTFFERQDSAANTKMKFPVIADFMAIMEMDPAPDHQFLASETRLIKIFSALLDSASGEDTFKSNNDSLFTDMRKVLEEISYYLYNNDYIDCWKGFAKISDYKRQIVANKDVPCYIQQAFYSLSEVLSQGSHALGVTNEVDKRNAPYVISFCSLALLNIMHWIVELDEK